MDLEDELKYYKEAYERQKAARKEAEKILEQKAIQLYKKNERLNQLNSELEENLLLKLQQIETNEKRFEEIINDASDIVYRVNQHGDFTYVNQSAIDISGFSRGELLKMNIKDLVVQPSYEHVIQFYSQQIDQKIDSTYFEYQIKSKGGNFYWLGQNVQLAFSGEEIEFVGIARDITKKVETNAMLRRSEIKYRSMLENLNLGVIEVDLEDKITKVYESFCELTGYDESELIGKKPSELILHPNYQATINEQNQKRTNGEASVYEIEIIKKDGESRWVMISGAPIFNEAGTIEGTVGIHLDITEQKILEMNLLEAKEKAEAMSKAKELFLANMSHEIRTPLNAIVGLAQLLNDTDLSQKQKEFTSTILESANNLASLVNNILDFSKIESGKLILEKNEINLYEMLQALLRPFHFQVESKGLVCSCDLEIKPDQFYETDKLRLTQVLSNLINNAIKFTPKGEIALSVKILENNTDKDLIRFEVKDTGIGISVDAQKHIFDEFVQANEHISSSYGGTGLGLSISKKIVTALSGELKLFSEEGKGTIFQFDIPIQKINKADSVVPTTNFTDDFWKTKLILVAEDNKVNQLVVTEMIKNWGASYVICENGQEVIEQLRHTHPHIILMDIKMPLMDGVDCTKMIRNNLEMEIPIIGLTANVVKGDRERYLQAGMNDCVSKPFNESQLKESVFYHLKKNSATRETRIFNLKKITDLIPDKKTVVHLLNLFLEESKESLDIIHSATKTEIILDLLHKMKASIGVLTDADLVRKISTLENEKPFDHQLLNEVLDEWKQLIEEVGVELNSQVNSQNGNN